MAKRRTLKSRWLKEKQRADELLKGNVELREMLSYTQRLLTASQHVDVRHFHLRRDFGLMGCLIGNVCERGRISAMLREMIESDEGYEFLRQAIVFNEQAKVITNTHLGRKFNLIASDLDIYVVPVSKE